MGKKAFDIRNVEIGVCGGAVVDYENVGDSAAFNKFRKVSVIITFVNNIGFFKSGSDIGCRGVSVGFLDDNEFSAVVYIGFDYCKRIIAAEENAVGIRSAGVTMHYGRGKIILKVAFVILISFVCDREFAPFDIVRIFFKSLCHIGSGIKGSEEAFDSMLRIGRIIV